MKKIIDIQARIRKLNRGDQPAQNSNDTAYVDWTAWKTVKYWPYGIALQILKQSNEGSIDRLNNELAKIEDESHPEGKTIFKFQEEYGERVFVVEPGYFFVWALQAGFDLPAGITEYLTNRAKLETRRMDEETDRREAQEQTTEEPSREDEIEDTTSLETVIIDVEESNDENKLSLPVEAGTEWNDVTITLLSTDTVQVKVKDKSQRFTFAELKFSDKRSGDKATMLWHFLLLLIKEKGFITGQTDNYNPNIPVLVKRFKVHMKNLFGIEEAVFDHYKKGSPGYKANFNTADSTHGTYKDLMSLPDSP